MRAGKKRRSGSKQEVQERAEAHLQEGVDANMLPMQRPLQPPLPLLNQSNEYFVGWDMVRDTLATPRRVP